MLKAAEKDDITPFFLVTWNPWLHFLGSLVNLYTQTQFEQLLQVLRSFSTSSFTSPCPHYFCPLPLSGQNGGCPWWNSLEFGKKIGDKICEGSGMLAKWLQLFFPTLSPDSFLKYPPGCFLMSLWTQRAHSTLYFLFFWLFYCSSITVVWVYLTSHAPTPASPPPSLATPALVLSMYPL